MKKRTKTRRDEQKRVAKKNQIPQPLQTDELATVTGGGLGGGGGDDWGSGGDDWGGT